MWTVIGGFLCDCIRFIGVFSDGRVLYWRSLQLIWPRPNKTTHSDHEYSYYSLMKLHYRMNTPRLDALISAIIAMCQRQNPVKNIYFTIQCVECIGFSWNSYLVYP